MSTTTLGQQSGWAGDLLTSVGDSTSSTGSVVSWLQNNLGNLNGAIGTSYSLSGDDLSPGLSMESSGVYTEMYYCYFLARQATRSIGELSFDWVSIQGDDQGSVRRVTGNEKAKTYGSLAKDCRERLSELIDWYNQHANPSLPCQTLYNSRSGSAASGIREYGSYYPPESLFSNYNVVWTSA